MKHLQPGQAGVVSGGTRACWADGKAKEHQLKVQIGRFASVCLLAWVVGLLARPLQPRKRGLVKCLEPMATLRIPTGPTKEAPALLQISVLQPLSLLQNKQQFVHTGFLGFLGQGWVIRAVIKGFCESTSAFYMSRDTRRPQPLPKQSSDRSQHHTAYLMWRP